jgi:hypothetical protein
MINKWYRNVGIMLVLLTLFTGCVTTGNVYQTNATISEQVVTLMERYELWYQAADPETQAEWREYFDPMFEQLDLLMDTYDQMVADGMDTVSILEQIDRLKTYLMIQLIKRNQENEG